MCMDCGENISGFYIESLLARATCSRCKPLEASDKFSMSDGNSRNGLRKYLQFHSRTGQTRLHWSTVTQVFVLRHL